MVAILELHCRIPDSPCADPRHLSRKLGRDISTPGGRGEAIDGVQASDFRYVVTLQLCVHLVMVYC